MARSTSLTTVITLGDNESSAFEIQSRCLAHFQLHLEPVSFFLAQVLLVFVDGQRASE